MRASCSRLTNSFLRLCTDVNHGNYRVSLDWTLDGGAHAIVFAQPDIVSCLGQPSLTLVLQLQPEIAANPGEHVLTPYGTGAHSLLLTAISLTGSGTTGTMLSVRADGTHVVHLNQLQGSSTVAE